MTSVERPPTADESQPAEAQWAPSRVRTKVLADHVALRALITPIENLARRVISGDEPSASELPELAEHFLAELARHMSWEDEHLAPTLREIDAWGEERARRLAEEHHLQRELLSQYLQRLREPETSKQRIASDVLELGVWLREDMAAEEESTLHPNLLRDDVIAIDADTG